MITLHHPTFSTCAAFPPSSVFTTQYPLKQQQQHFRKSSTFRITSLGSADIAQIAHNKVLVAAGASALIGQLFKLFSNVLLYGKEFDVKSLIQAGGFPSSHSSATVACATYLGLERGFADPIFGLTVVYAGIIMYDSQGVRREVGIHARTLNRLLLHSLSSKEKEGLINSKPGRLSSPPNVQGLEKRSRSSQEATSSDRKRANNARLLVTSGNKTRQTDSAEEISRLVADGVLPLKESIGHTGVEVIAGALLGVLVGSAVYNFV